MTTQVFLASTAFGLATLAAALDQGLFSGPTLSGRSRSGAERRILVLTNNATMPEGTPDVDQIAGWPMLRTRFDEVYDHNLALAPLHPAGWAPRSAELPLWERHFRSIWELGDDAVHLVLESIQANPALALARVFADASIDVYADGLMSYGPTRTTLPDDVGWRVERLLHLDLVPGLTPMLLTDWDVVSVVIGGEGFRAVIATLTPESVTRTTPVTLVLGQYLAAAGLLTETEELELYRELIEAAGRRPPYRVVFKPHPSAPLGQQTAQRSAARVAGVELEIGSSLELAESWFASGTVVEVVGCFSTALATAATLYDLPVARHGTEVVLRRMTPFHNSNRIPATIIDATVLGLPGVPVPGGTATAAAPVAHSELPDLVAAVGYTMQPVRYADRREVTVDFLIRHPELHRRYFRRQRLTRLDLPGRLPRRVRLGRSGLSQLRARLITYTGAR